jgi:XTP/dITP diphosphohydrolase
MRAHTLTTGLAPGDRLVVATHNRGKLREIADLVRPFGLEIVSAGALGLPEPEETGTSFEENARLKALASAAASGLPALADDSGVVVDALGGEPGIHSARWAGPNRDFAEAMRLVEERLQAVGATTPAKRTARFVAVLCLAFPDGSAETYRGEVAGTIVWPPRGGQGFGYDPFFLADGYERTFGEMTAEVKHGWKMGTGDGLSHRARAFAKFARARLGSP